MSDSDKQIQQQATQQQGSASNKKSCCCWWKYLCLSVFVLLLLSGIYLAVRFLTDEPVRYQKIEEHFKYGSLGGERNLGIPYWIWQAMPQMCADMLPDKQTEDVGFESVGMIYEGDNKLPVGVSSRRHLGIDRVFLNCAVCHTSTVQQTEESEPELVLGMPAHRFNLAAFEKFIFQCVGDQKFNRSYLIPTIESLGADLDLIDRYLVYPLAIWLVKERLQFAESRLQFVYLQPDWGPGRVDTFSSAKAIFNWNWDETPWREMIGTADLPSIWYQGPRKQRDDGKPMELHWDGNNDSMEERNLSAAFGAGAQPPIIDHDELARIENWLLDLAPPAFPFAVDQALVEQGKPIYQKYCSACHGASGTDFSGKKVGTVEPIDAIGTDRWRLDNYTRTVAINQAMLYAGDERYRFKRFHKTNGYANMPLDGIWLRAPYLHNGSVPTLHDLLKPAEQRPQVFYRGNDLYDATKVGFVSDIAEEKGRHYFRFDTRVDGNGSYGHEGYDYGTELKADQKQALLEYLKTF